MIVGCFGAIRGLTLLAGAGRPHAEAAACHARGADAVARRARWGGVAGLAAILAWHWWWPRDPHAHGIRIELPAGWSGRVFRAAGGLATLHAGDFQLPLDDGEFGDRSTGAMPGVARSWR